MQDAAPVLVSDAGEAATRRVSLPGLVRRLNIELAAAISQHKCGAALHAL